MALSETGIVVGGIDLKAVHLSVAAEGAAGDIRLDLGKLAAAGHERVEGIIGKKQAQLGHQAVVVQLRQLALLQAVHVVGPIEGVGRQVVGMPLGQAVGEYVVLGQHIGKVGSVVNADGLEGETDAPAGEVVPEFPGEAQPRTGLVLLEVAAVVLDLTVVQVHRKTQFAVEEIRLLEGDLIILVPGAGGDLQTEFLPAAGEERRVEQVEVALHVAYLGKQGHIGTVPESRDEVACPSLLHPNDEVAAVRQLRDFLDLRVDTVKKPGAFEPALAQLDTDHVEHLAGGDRQFTPDHLVLGSGVAADLHLFHVAQFALGDVVSEVYGALVGVGHLGHAHSGVEIAVRFVEVPDGVPVLVQPGGGEDGALKHVRGHRTLENLHPAAYLVTAEERVALEGDIADLILISLVQVQADHHPALLRVLELDLANLEVDVALILIKLGEHLEVLVPLVGLELAAAGQPRHPPAFACLDRLAQFALGEGHHVLEHDVVNLDLPPGIDLEDDGRLAKRLVVPDIVLDLGLMVAAFLVLLQDGASVGEYPWPTEGLPSA